MSMFVKVPVGDTGEEVWMTALQREQLKDLEPKLRIRRLRQIGLKERPQVPLSNIVKQGRVGTGLNPIPEDEGGPKAEKEPGAEAEPTGEPDPPPKDKVASAFGPNMGSIVP